MTAHHNNPTETRRQAMQAALDATKSAAERKAWWLGLTQEQREEYLAV